MEPMDELLLFLCARLYRRESVAQAAHPITSATALRWKVMPYERRIPGAGLKPARVWGVVTNPGEMLMVDAYEIKGDVAEHVVLHDPVSVLADVSSDWQIIKVVTGWRHPRLFDGCEENTGPYTCSRDGATCDCGLYDQQMAVLRSLAMRDAGHPDFRAAWTL